MRKISVKFSVVLILDPGGIQKGPVKLGLLVLPFLCLSVFPSIRPDVFLNLDYYFFLNFGSVRNSYEVVCDRARFFGKFFVLQKLGKLIKK